VCMREPWPRLTTVHLPPPLIDCVLCDNEANGTECLLADALAWRPMSCGDVDHLSEDTLEAIAQEALPSTGF
jgi:hypothetical protein